ncbi:MAG TPA: peptidylprolyl isomerase [Anaeromyxobacter sp.]|nr:peptidylprolyl isomerase [Anaeromyxobacter sp.]
MIAPALLLAALAAAPGDEVVARVDGIAIPRSAVVRRASDFRARGESLQPAEVLASLVDEALLAAEGERLGLRQEPAVAARLEAERRRIAAEVLVETEIASGISPPEDALRRMFHGTADSARLQLLIYETKDAAQAARDRLAQGGSLEAEARAALIAKVAPRDGGAPEAIRAQLDPALAEAVFGAAPGALVGPVALKNGFAVARVIELNVAAEAEYAARREAVLRHARKELTAQAVSHYTGQLRKQAGVTLDEPFLQGLQGLQASPAELDHVLATVGGRSLRYRDIHPSLEAVAAGSGHMAGPTIKIQLAWREIDARLLQDVAVQRGYEKRPETLARAAVAERNVLALALADRIRASAPPPSEAEIQEFYGRNAAAYGRPFEQVLPDAAARAGAEKREAAVLARARELRARAAITIDQAALARAGAAGA